MDGPVYRNREHEERYRGLMGHRQILALDQKASYACALYLLAADGYLWDKARDAITMSQGNLSGYTAWRHQRQRIHPVPSGQGPVLPDRMCEGIGPDGPQPGWTRDCLPSS